MKITAQKHDFLVASINFRNLALPEAYPLEGTIKYNDVHSKEWYGQIGIDGCFKLSPKNKVPLGILSSVSKKG